MNSLDAWVSSYTKAWVRITQTERGSLIYQAIYKAKCIRAFRSRQRAIEFIAAFNKLFN